MPSACCIQVEGSITTENIEELAELVRVHMELHIYEVHRKAFRDRIPHSKSILRMKDGSRVDIDITST